MKEIKHHLKFWWVSFGVNMSQVMQYRLDFWVGLLASAGWTLIALVFLTALYNKTPQIAGWRYHEVLIVLGFYRFIEGLGEFLFYRSFKRFSEDIRRGRLDLLLSKPLDLQFYLSFRYTMSDGLANSLAGVGLFFYGLSHARPMLTLTNLVAFFALALAGFLFYYSLWFAVNLLNFWLVKVDNLRNLIHGLVATTRFPPEAYGRKAEVFLSFVIPLALIVAFPVKVLLARGEWWYLPFSLILSLFFLVLTRYLFRLALRSYTGAGG